MKSPSLPAPLSALRQAVPSHLGRLLFVAVASLLAGLLLSLPVYAAGASSNGSVTTDDASTVPVFFPTDNVPQGQVGVFYTYQTAAMDAPPSGGYSAIDLPTGLVIDAATGLISGKPTQSGTSTVTLSCINSAGTGTATFALVIRPPLPVLTIVAEANGFPAQGLGHEASFLITRTGDTSAPLKFSVIVGGSAVPGTDYQFISLVKKFKIKAGSSTKRIRIFAVDESGQGVTKKRVKFVLQTSADYALTEVTAAKVKLVYNP